MTLLGVHLGLMARSHIRCALLRGERQLLRHALLRARDCSMYFNGGIHTYAAPVKSFLCFYASRSAATRGVCVNSP